MTKAIEEIERSKLAIAPFSSSFAASQPVLSSVASSSKIAPMPSTAKPTLSSPVHRTIDLFVNKAEPTFSKYTESQQRELESLLEKIRTFQQEESIQMEKVEQAKADVSFWSMLTDMASVVSSGCSIYFGAAFISAGAAPIGGALIASGVLSIGNLACKYGGVWDYLADQVAEKGTPLHQSFTHYIPSAIGLTSAAISAYGSYTYWQLASASGLDQVKSILGTIGSITTGLTHFEAHLSQSHLSFANKDLSFLRSNNHFTTMEFENLSQDINEYIEKQLLLHKTLSHIIRESESMNQAIQQPI